jgi:hypothetical protein
VQPQHISACDRVDGMGIQRHAQKYEDGGCASRLATVSDWYRLHRPGHWLE